MDINRFRSLSAKHRALLAIAVLLDEQEASSYLENDDVNGAGLKRIADELSNLELETRVALSATLLRDALVDLNSK